jgi:1-acyl-sn-glycerol-3-phosphate acyltransferase
MLNYFIVAVIITFFSRFNMACARPRLTKLVSFTGRVGLKIIGINVVQNSRHVGHAKNFLIVSNHLGYLDILVISSFFPSCFVTSMEMKKTFFLGQICLLAGCLFVDRKNRRNIHKEVSELTKALQAGLSVVIFPEARSTDGSLVVAFKRPLFQAAIDAKSSVLPICLNYKSINKQEVTAQNRDVLFWYGNKLFITHVIKLFAHKNILVEMNIFPDFSASNYKDKLEISDKCHELLSSKYRKIAH